MNTSLGKCSLIQNVMNLEQLMSRRRLFGRVFFVALAIFIASIAFNIYSDKQMINSPGVIISGNNNEAVTISPEDPNPGNPSTDSKDSGTFEASIVVPIASLFASIASLIGFLSTTMLAWRKERRETLSHERELEKRNLEIAKLRQELNTDQSE